MNVAAAPPQDDVLTREPLIRIRGLHTVLNGKTIFDGVDLDIPRGRVTAVMGPSGTG
jgi:phospholipid/cholesterol/gamma-HCH transport system ATP-binding protein